MIQFELLLPDPGFELTIEPESGQTGIELPFVVPLYFAQQGSPDGVLLWADRELKTVGFYQPGQRTSWSAESVGLLNIAVLHPSAERPGVVGLELALEDQAEEVPILATNAYSRAALDWFKERRSLWETCFGVAVSVRDYGFA